jgi:predicted site-specific integrase-resolvase
VRHTNLRAGSTGDDLVDDVVAVITSMAAGIYGRRNRNRRAERVKECIEHVIRNEVDE